MIAKTLDTIACVAQKPSVELHGENHEQLVVQTGAFLESDAAMKMIELDAYWPKWDSPWWQMLLLHEMDLTHRIPKRAIDAIVEALGSKYTSFFPLIESEIPEGIDPRRNIPCHCQLGTMHQLLTAYGVNVEDKLPWIDPWFLRYQLPDGALNCDESAYTKAIPKGSVVSTVAVLEAVIRARSQLTAAQVSFADRAVEYLLSKRLCRRSTTSEPIDERWFELCFPRYYHFDILRGLSVVLQWAQRCGRKIPALAIAEIVSTIDKNFPDGQVYMQRDACTGIGTIEFDGSSGQWRKAPERTFSLMQAVTQRQNPNVFLTRRWNETRQALRTLLDKRLIVEEC